MGIPGNEKADKTAIHALINLHHQIPFSYVKNLVGCFTLIRWQES